MAFDGGRGELLILGGIPNGHSRFFVRRRYESPTPPETCTEGEDADGDELAA